MGRMCGGCDKTWTGLKVCHCGVCHQTFNVLAWFDGHRRQGRGDRPGYCLDPATLRQSVGDDGVDKGPLLKLNKNDVWVGAAPVGVEPWWESTKGDTECQ